MEIALKLRSFAFASATLLIVAGCGVQDGQYVTGKTTQKDLPEVTVVEADQIQLFASKPERSFTPITDIKVTVNKLTAFHPNPTEEQARKALREEAARHGADAVVNVVVSDVKIGLTSWGVRNASGTAVKY